MNIIAAEAAIRIPTVPRIPVGRYKKATQKAAIESELEKTVYSLPTLKRLSGTGVGDASAKTAATTRRLTAKLTEASYEGDLFRKYISGKGFSSRELKDWQHVYGKLKTSDTDLANKIGYYKIILPPGEKNIIGRMNARPASFLERQRARLSFFAEKHTPKFVSRISARLASTSEWRVFKYARGTYVGYKITIKGVKSAALIGSIVAAQYVLSGGDWGQTALFAAQATVLAYAPKLAQKLIVEKSITFFGRTLVRRNPVNIAFEGLKGALASVPGFGTAACMGTHVAQVSVNVVWSIIDTISYDLALIKVYDGAGSAVRKEKAGFACKTFSVADTKPLLSPPNCNPEAKSEQAVARWSSDPLRKASLIATSSSLVAATAVSVASASLTCTPAGAAKTTISTGAMALVGGSLTATGVTIGFLANDLIRNPLDVVPKTTCDESCDRSRQDCPNWYISKTRDDFGTAQAVTMVGLMQGGPACTAISVLTGWGSMTCNAARIMSAVTLFFSSPERFFHWMLQGDTLGFTKKIGAKSAPELGMTDKEFAGNEGFWYAEFPYAIEITKVYTDDENANNRNRLVIRKV